MAKHPEFTPVKSSMLSGYAYDPDTRILHAQFKNGSVYTYVDVPAERVATMAENASPGSYFNSQIKGQYGGKRL